MTVQLPAWATLAEHAGKVPVVHVDAEKMYATWLGILRDTYKDGHPDFAADDGTLTAEWATALEELRSDTPTAYWLEVCYQCGKLDEQDAMIRALGARKGFHFERRIHDPDRLYAQKSAPQGRDVLLAAGQQLKANEARAHYKRIRGYVPGT